LSDAAALRLVDVVVLDVVVEIASGITMHRKLDLREL
jgi:predicted site-specific integrase-resolvase